MDLDKTLSQLRTELDTSLSHLRTEMQFCPECGSQVDADSAFCPNCGTRLIPEDPTPALSEGASAENILHGILFTDSEILARKYHCKPEEVTLFFEGLISRCAPNEWSLLDVAEYKSQVGDGVFWMDYNQLISDYMEQHKCRYGMKTPVFIIGGHDVIPIPMVEDVFGSSEDGKIPCDMCYCFSGNFFSDLWEGNHTITEEYVRNTVARLPLEDGELQSSLLDDIDSYFNLCFLYYEEGIPAENVMMAANASWLPASKTMSEHLPLINDALNTDLEQDGMYVCPPVSPEDEETIDPVCASMEQAGMLLFNLHGSDQEGYSGFFHDKGEAFSPEMLSNTSARVLNTVACFGARYHGYKRDDSMLLTAFYKRGFLLYVGSLIPVPMTELEVPEGVEVHAGSGSEHLMPIYCMEQYAGLPAGEAMMKAKLEYFNTFRHLERDDFSLATMMMFSLYGNPMLRLQQNDDVLELSEQLHVLPKLPQAKTLIDATIRMKQTKRLIDNTLDSASGLLADIRESVDANFSAMHQSILQNLYNQLGLESRWLDHVDSYSLTKRDGTIEKGYVYAYKDQTKAFGNKSWVEVDNRGNITRISTIK